MSHAALSGSQCRATPTKRKIAMHLNHTQLVSVLLDLIEKVHKGDSFEGTFSYSAIEVSPDEMIFETTAAYRIGNLEGQGGVRSIHPYQAPDTSIVPKEEPKPAASPAPTAAPKRSFVKPAVRTAAKVTKASTKSKSK